jgi:hypothetical protein
MLPTGCAEADHELTSIVALLVGVLKHPDASEKTSL